MTSIIKLQAIYGEVEEAPHCYLLQVDEFRILLDCGWDEHFNLNLVKELKKHVSQIDAVLLSYPDHLHLGALPYMVGKGDLNCPIYATIPVYKMGQMFMYDLYQSHSNVEEFTIFTLDDVDAAFDKIIQLKYNQTVTLKGKGFGLTITPVPAGHMIGGTVWKIVKDGEEDIWYAVDFNHKKERHLNGCNLDTIGRPSLLITDALNVNYQQQRRRARDEQLMTNILQTLRSSGNVLVCTDTAGRVLELAHMVDQLWRNQESGLMAYSLALINNVSYNVVEFAKSQIEWMSEKLMRSFEANRNNPFQFKHLQLCHSLAELARVPEPKVVLASMPDLESGFSRDLFMSWCQRKNNSIIFTSRTSPSSLARHLIENPVSQSLQLSVSHRVRLEGAELEEYLKTVKEKDALNKKQDRTEESSSDESDDEMELGKSAKRDFIVAEEHKTHSSTGFFKATKKTMHPMFPFTEEKIRSDDYGQIIRPEDYMIVEPALDDTHVKEEVESKEKELIGDLEIPTKCISSVQTFHVQAQMQYIDFEGRSDGESIKKIISQVKPRRLLIVRGSADACKALQAHALKNGVEKSYITKGTDVIDASTESHIYQVRLKDSLIAMLHFSRGGREEGTPELSWIDGVICMRPRYSELELAEKEERHDIDMLDDSGTKELIPTLEPLPLEDVPGHETSFVNDVKLSDFKQILTKEGIPSEFSAGILWCCNGTVALRRHDAGRITMEGSLSSEYYTIRDLLYQQYSIV
ncbi:unnamed protein product [Darwinula stevensoni]|uniref:Cleavage and polyadenylation specificity factor subunit 2 n=1 Tax=Darwinula stevensoni TaxID=69355 RepID=A0A7R8X9W7_9CRUS|nr:unnamed protein product [Darwinula stevensoni]CAG0891466.1 unnamed protein product [Darwinula stevensoni]